MYKYIITALIFLSLPTLSFASELSGFSRAILPSEPFVVEPVGIDRISNRWRDGSYIVRIRLTDKYWNYQNKYIYDYDPSNLNMDYYAEHKITGDVVTLPTTIPIAEYPDDFVKPVKGNIKHSQEYGKTSFSKFHTGLDFSVKDVPVFNVSNGKVIYSGKDIFSTMCNNGGNMIKIQHENGLYSAYFHLKELSVKKDDVLEMGKRIGTSGNTGKYGCLPLSPHLHFEIRTGSNQSTNIDPRLVIQNI